MGACLCPVWSRDCSPLLLASAPLLAAGSGVCKRDYVSFGAVRRGRGVKASEAAQAGTGGSDRAAHRPARLPGAVQNTWRGDRGLPLREGGKNNNLKAKKPGAAGSVFITVKKKALFPASPQRLFITHTRVWRKCSICWVQPSTHTAYKLRAFTCRVPEIKHTHTHKRERSFVSAPAHCLSLAVPVPQPRPALAPVQEFHIISDRFQLPQQGTALLLSSCSHIWKVLRQGVSRQSRAAGMCFPPPARSLLPSCPPLPSSFELPSPEGCGAEFCLPRLFGEF